MMNALILTALAASLAMDAFTVSISYGCHGKKIRWKHTLLIAGSFGLFQMLMPLAGWAAGELAAPLIRRFDHWIAFGLLTAIGIKMGWEFFLPGKEERDCEYGEFRLSLRRLLVLSVATSIDALAAGISLIPLGLEPVTSSAVIGLFTFGICLFGVRMGCSIQKRIGKTMDLAGGLILIAIGTKILVEHLVKG
jgi:putative Mn2+ efflux pump MntP